MLPGLTVHMCQKQINAFSKPIQNLFFYWATQYMVYLFSGF